jgi:protein-L-isoaspartate(D-aspartate) O-methyltransferase
MPVIDRFTAQKNMILGQVLPHRVTDPKLLAVLARIPRKLFVPEAFEGIACIDGQVPLGYNRYLISPHIFSALLDRASIKDTDSVLDIGCGTGYSTAVIAHLARKVVGLESNSDLASKAHTRLNKLHIENGIIMTGSLTNGHGDGGPYDVIIINGSIDCKPESLFEQLALGGRLVCVFSHTLHHGTLTCFSRQKGGIVKTEGDFASCAKLDELCTHHHELL